MRDGMRGSGLQGKVQVGNWGKFLLEKLFQPLAQLPSPGGLVALGDTGWPRVNGGAGCSGGAPRQLRPPINCSLTR